jgi:hypothetical protein
MFNLSARGYWIRPGIDIRPTTVAADPGGRGAFAGPLGLRRGSFVGVYRGGRWRSIGPFANDYRGKDDYVMEVAGWRCTPARRNNGLLHVDVGEYPMATVLHLQDSHA